MSSATRRHAAQAELRADEALVHHAALGEFEDLGVDEHGLAEHLAVFERPPHDLGGVDRRAVVGERDRAALDQPAELGQFLPLAVLGHRADREDVAVAGALGLLDDELGGHARVEGRLGVRHARDRRDAAGDGRGRAGGDGLVLLAARLAQVDVHVDEAGRDDQPGAVEGPVGGRRDCGAEPRTAVGEPEVGDGVEAGATGRSPGRS